MLVREDGYRQPTLLVSRASLSGPNLFQPVASTASLLATHGDAAPGRCDSLAMLAAHAVERVYPVAACAREHGERLSSIRAVNLARHSTVRDARGVEAGPSRSLIALHLSGVVGYVLAVAGAGHHLDVGSICAGQAVKDGDARLASDRRSAD